MPVRNPASILFIFLALCLTTGASGQTPSLGRIEFPTSGSGEAQQAFINGVLLLHSFEYDDAADAFRKAHTIEPKFGMAYWGEAMTFNHPLWAQQDLEAAEAALNGLAPTAEERSQYFPTEKEKAFHHAVETLYGNTEASAGKSKEDRDDLYMEEMRRMYEAYPKDDEVTTFYALSILGTAHEGRDFTTYMKAASIAFQVWERNKLHPGAAHYLIHSFDDPVHAPLGLPMARAYSKIAPAAAHAQHMTSHIFVALGMWDDVVRANVIADSVQNARFAERGRRPSVCGHYTFWLEYGYLEQGRTDKAKSILDACYTRMANEPNRSERSYFGSMLARYVVDAEDYDAIDHYVFDFGDDLSSGSRDYHFARAYAAAQLGRIGESSADQIQIIERASEDNKIAPILSAQIDGILALHHGELDRALEILTSAAETEAALPFDYGPPDPAKPGYELLGESLMELGRYQGANEAFRTQLKRTINRTASLAGLASTAKELGDATTAAEASAKLAAIRVDR
jgi:tetratricopeptide (TPR) repeat protein